MTPLTTRLKTWLNTIPIKDPVQRQMAALLQVVLLGLMVVIVLATIALLVIPTNPVQETSQALKGNFMGFLVVLLPFLLLRRGYFRGAVLIIITILFITPALAITVVFDLHNSGGILFQFTLAIILSGLLVDRRTLGVVYGLSAVIVAFSAIQMQSGEPDLAGRSMETAVNFILFNGLMALFLDRFGITLRAALRDTLVRENELHDEIASRERAEKRFQLVVESAPNAILLVDRRGNIAMVNSQVEKYFGFDRADLAGTGVDRLVPERFRSQHPAYRDSFRADPQTRPMGAGRDLFGVRKDGSEFPVEIGLTPIEMQDGPMVMATIVDITERKGVEAQNRFLANLVASVSDAIVAVDLQQHIQSWNTGAEAMYGWREAEVLGQPAKEVLDTDFLKTTREAVTKQILEQGYWSGEVIQLHRDGTMIPALSSVSLYMNAEGKPAGIVAVNRDITERKHTDRQLERQNQRLNALREIDTAILASESIENIAGNALGHIRELIDCRRASLILIDWKSNEALTFSISSGDETSMRQGTRIPLLLSGDLLHTLSQNQPVLINDLSALTDPLPQFQAGIEEGFRSVCILPLFSQNNLIGSFNMSSEIPGFFDEEKINLGREVANQVAIAITQGGLINDLQKLTEELEQRVVERTLQLESANQELEAFSYSVSHDLRAPLRAINGFSLALSSKHAESIGEQGIHYLNRIQENTRHMGELIDDLLTLSRITRREMEAGDVNLSALAQEIAGELRTLEPERQVAFEIEDQLEVRGDAGLIRVVLHNLIGNAWKFTSARAQAHIRFGVASSLAVGDVRSDEGETVYFVQDNGVGFDMAYADKLFGAFQRLHTMAEFPGTGIGLATVQRIIHRHGGRIWVEAELDKGAAFYFTLGGSHEKQ
ncbi:MAG TPA: PAS domain S-box protein [Anaerolineales bacterium]|nr:PAS domain S-box protein [Anaerolineales bacterium]